MNYATQYPIGNYHHTRTKTTTAIAPTVGRVRQLDAKAKRCQRGAERQTKISTNTNVANGFLKCTFLPKLKKTQTVQACTETAKTERDFYKSLSKLAVHYSIEPMQTNQFAYPYNIALSIWDIEENLKQRVLNWEAIHLVQDSKKVYFVSEEKYDTGTTLYYIPIEPLYQMLHDPKRKKNAQLLISVCAYLYHIADIPYYRQEDSYLYWMYEMHKDWVEEDDETDETEGYKREFIKSELVGDYIEQKIFNRANLEVFQQRLNAFKTRDAFDHDCWQIACNAFALYTECPTASIFRNAPLSKQDPYNDEYDNEAIGMEKYISFIAHTKGWLYESIADSINNEFNEYGAMEEPTICKPFDGSEINATTLDFENRLFALLENICCLLYNYETTRK
ncbi:hypothetical protein MWU76_12820 [Gelidibacter sp. F2691]|nr:hypothetical protein [Gelidibacter sp. F2691]